MRKRNGKNIKRARNRMSFSSKRTTKTRRSTKRTKNKNTNNMHGFKPCGKLCGII